MNDQNPFKSNKGFGSTTHAHEVDDFHRRADTDSSDRALHHTLGDKSGQAAPGARTLKRINDVQNNLNFTNFLMNGISDRTLKVGMVTMFYGSTGIPTDWLLMDGSTFSAATYPDLQTFLGSTTLPDMRDLFPVGASGTKAVRSTGGAATATLTAANLPAHAHDMTHTHDISHTHTITHNHAITRSSVSGTSGTTVVRGGTSDVGDANTGASSAASTGAASTANSGGSSTANTGNGPGTGTAVNIQNPYRAINFIIRAKNGV